MIFRKIVFIAGFLAIAGFIFNFSAPSAKAMTAGEIQAMIQQLQAQIAQLQKQLAETEAKPVVWCHDFNTNLRIENAGDEVAALQTALQKEGFYQPAVNQPPHFDEEVASAVVGFQEKYASEILVPWGLKRGTGYVGSSTRAKLNALYKCGVPPTPATPGVPTTPATPVTTVGSLSLSLSYDTPASQIVAAGSGGVSDFAFTKINFTADKEDINIKEFVIRRIDDGCNKSDFGSISLWDSATQIGVDSYLTTYLLYYDEAIFTLPADNYWRIPKNVTKTLTIKADINGIGTDATIGSKSGCAHLLSLYSINAVGVESASEAISGEGVVKIDGNRMIIRKSKPTVASANLPSTVLTSGEKVLYRWTVSADSKGDIGWKKVKFNIIGTLRGSPISASNISNLKVWNVNDGTQIAGTVSGLATFEATSEQIVPVGTAITYELRGDVLLAPIGDDYIVTKIRDESTSIISFSYTLFKDGSLVWTDRSAASHSEATSDWANDYKVPGIPTAALSLVKGAPTPTPTITVTSPNGGEQWQIGKTYNITWTVSGASENSPINIWATNADSSVYENSKCSVTATGESVSTSGYGYKSMFCGTVKYFGGNYKYSYTVPSHWAAGSKYKINIAVPGASDASESYFSIAAATPVVTCTDSDGGKNYFTKGTVTYNGQTNYVPDTYGGNIYTDACGGTSSVNEFYCENNVLKAVSALCSSGYNCASGACVTAATPTPTITVTSPNGGEQWQIGKTYDIKWQYLGPYNVYISLDKWSADGNSVYGGSIISEISGSIGKYSWTIPQNQELGSYYKVNIGVLDGSSRGSGGLADASDNYFSIVEAAVPSIAVTYPLANDTLQKGSVSYVNFKFSPSVPKGGFAVNLIRPDTGESIAHLKYCGLDNVTYDAVVPPNVSWKWKVGYDGSGAEIPNGLYRIFVYDCGDKTDPVWTGSVASAKSGIFNIVSITVAPSITVTSPNGGEQWQIGKTYNITWNSTGVSNVNILLYNQFGAQQATIVSNLVNDGADSWTIPSTIAPGQYKIYIYWESNVKDQKADDYSDGYFSIAAATPVVTCTDTDGGKNYFTKGTVTYNGQTSYVPDTYGGSTYTDACGGTSSVNEFYCENNALKAVSALCSSGYNCASGACVITTTIMNQIENQLADISRATSELLEAIAKIIR